MDTISRFSVKKAVSALGLDPSKVDHIRATPHEVTSSRTGAAHKPLLVLALQHLGFDPKDVLEFEITPKEVTVKLLDRDERGVPFGTRTEVCNVG